MNSLKASLIGLGTIAAAIGCYGAYEQSAAINGGYLMIAAPVVALASAVIPYFAEEAWKAGHKLKAAILALILIPAAATVFYAAAERVHLAKAGAEAERASMRSAVILAENALGEAKASVVRAEADSKAARGKRSCNTDCLARWDNAAAAARKRVADATLAVTATSGRASEESPLKAPVWLLPLALDLVAFISIWTGLSLAASEKTQFPTPPVETPVKKQPKRKPRKQRQALGRGLATFSIINGGKP